MAQKETVNTFTGGLVMDTHPLTTPNNVLTNCLNGTLVTFNGNEMILQNDLGNAKIESKENGDCVKLPEGFVPVGTAELGGIIYISSFNPETKECQLGCFPSPERNETTSEMTDGSISYNDDNFDYEDLINLNDLYPITLTDNQVQYTCKALNNGFIKVDLTNVELHAGDKYTINKLNGTLDPNCEFKLISTSEDGNIMDLDYTFGVQKYYTAPNSGKLSMLISVKKLNSFTCTYADLQKGGSYTLSNEALDSAIELEESTVPTKYRGTNIRLFKYVYKQVNSTYDNVELINNPTEEIKQSAKEVTITAKTAIKIDKYFYFKRSTQNPNIPFVQCSENEITDFTSPVLLRDLCFKTQSGNVIEYYDLLETIENNETVYKFQKVESDLKKYSIYDPIIITNDLILKAPIPQVINLTVVTLNDTLDDYNITTIPTKYFKIKNYIGYYYWGENGWKLNLHCSWNNKNKEDQDYSSLEGIYIKELGQTLYKPENGSNDLTVDVEKEDVDGKIILTVYPIVKVGTYYGYIKELIQEVVIDTTLEEGEVKLTMWKYYYDGNISLHYGLAGRLSSDDEILAVTISAIEYAEYDLNQSPEEIVLINIKDKESYFGSFSEELNLSQLGLKENKLYAVKIKIETNYREPIYEYRWLYTNNVFNDYYNSEIVDYNDCKIKLNSLKCNLIIGQDNDSSFIQSNSDLVKAYNKRIDVEATSTTIPGDYASYGYTKTEFDDDIPYAISYNSGNELFEINENKIKSEIVDLRTTDIEAPFAETDRDRDILNSFKGQLNEGTISEIWTSPSRYKNYTDCIEITDYDLDNIRFKGRLYNKIKGKITTTEIDGKEIYAPLVYDRSTAYNYNLDVSNNEIKALYYLTIEVNPSFRLWYTAKINWNSCSSTFSGTISEYKTKLIKEGSTLTTVNSLSGTAINSNYRTWFGCEDGTLIVLKKSLNDNVLTSNGPIHKQILTDLKDVENITKCSIIPVLLNKLNGFSYNIMRHSGNDDRGTETELNKIMFKIENRDQGSGDYYSDSGVISGQQEIHASRNGNLWLKVEFKVNSPNNLLGTIALLHKATGNIILLNDNLCWNSEVYDLPKKIFNLLSLIYVKSGQQGSRYKYCLSSYDYLQDYHAKVKISGHIKSKIEEHYLIKQCSGFDDWTNKNNLMIESYEKQFDIDSYKMFYADQKLIKEYDSLLEAAVKGVDNEDTGNVISCFKGQDGLIIQISEPDAGNNDKPYYIVNSNYKLVGFETGMTIYWQCDSEVSVSDTGKITCSYSSIDNGLTYSFLLFDQDTLMIYSNTNSRDGKYLVFRNETYNHDSDGDISNDSSRHIDCYGFAITDTIDEGL